MLDAGFLEGHLINIVGWEPATWRLVKILADGTLHLRGDGKYVLPANEGQLPAYVQPSSGTLTTYVQGAHGGLTVVHGGGNRPVRLVGELSTAGNTLTRTDGRSWAENGFQVGQYIQVGTEAFTRQILGFANSTCPPPPPGQTGWAGCGVGSVLLLSGPIGVSLAGQVEVHAAKAHIDTATGQMEIHTDHLIWNGVGDWARRRLRGRPDRLHLRHRRRLHGVRHRREQADAVGCRPHADDPRPGRPDLLDGATHRLRLRREARRRPADRRRRAHRLRPDQPRAVRPR